MYVRPVAGNSASPRPVASNNIISIATHSSITIIAALYESRYVHTVTVFYIPEAATTSSYHALPSSGGY